MSKYNLIDGSFTFEQRISLGNLFSSEKSDKDKFVETFVIMDGKKPHPSSYPNRLKDFEEIVKGLKFWMEKEATMLAYEPSMEELSAGIKKLSERLGHLGTVTAIAERFCTPPDEILQWKYAQIFSILYADKEKNDYNIRYTKALERKYANR